MTPPASPESEAARLQTLFAKHLGLRRGPLAARIRRTRGRLPEAVRRDAQKVADAAACAGHPRLAATTDPAALAAARARVEAYLTGPEMRAARMTARLRWLAAMAGNLLIIAALVVTVLVWRGLI